MAQKTVVHLTDDLDGGDADQSITFAYRGKSFALDLSGKNVQDFEEMLTPYMDAARKAGTAGSGDTKGRATKGQRSAGKPSSGSEVDAKAVRAWAEQNGIEVNKRGRISSSVVLRFQEAQA